MSNLNSSTLVPNKNIFLYNLREPFTFDRLKVIPRMTPTVLLPVLPKYPAGSPKFWKNLGLKSKDAVKPNKDKNDYKQLKININLENFSKPRVTKSVMKKFSKTCTKQRKSISCNRSKNKFKDSSLPHEFMHNISKRFSSVESAQPRVNKTPTLLKESSTLQMSHPFRNLELKKLIKKVQAKKNMIINDKSSRARKKKIKISPVNMKLKQFCPSSGKQSRLRMIRLPNTKNFKKENGNSKAPKIRQWFNLGLKSQLCGKNSKENAKKFSKNYPFSGSHPHNNSKGDLSYSSVQGSYSRNYGLRRLMTNPEKSPKPDLDSLKISNTSGCSMRLNTLSV
ncbi:unnamed protein product [Moneuplotes crassus]|uniref:Uncharacterized protein n=1 Tax=Euplotes crassus TaxID=5936 RepID=A0AAD1UEK2_EUPCR|nr:unnamed protein product [Moneuplotes crassus]